MILKEKIKRFERKWVYNDVDYLTLFIALLRSNFFFSIHYPKRKINSLYFDDLNYSSIRENLDGTNKKIKYRIRWYGLKEIINNPIFEIKSKKGFETQKKFFKIEKINKLSLFNQKNLDIITEIINNESKIQKKIYPVLTTHYDREYYISNNKLIRATLDYNLQSIFVKKNEDLNIIRQNYSNITLEIKYDINLDKYVRDNLKTISARLSRNSKYCNSALLSPTSYS